MNRLIFPALILIAIASGGCDNGSVDETVTETTVSTRAPEVSFKPGAVDDRTAKPQGPVTIGYRIIGTPIVGQPVGVDLLVTSTLGPQPITLSFRVNDSTAMQFPEEQLLSISMAASNAEGPRQQQVRIIPMREGRLFLNVSATIKTDSGSMSTVTAIPIQVGAATREISENGEVLTDENGELIRSLPASEE